jgi:hypothetical protein
MERSEDMQPDEHPESEPSAEPLDEDRAYDPGDSWTRNVKGG